MAAVDAARLSPCSRHADGLPSRGRPARGGSGHSPDQANGGPRVLRVERLTARANCPAGVAGRAEANATKTNAATAGEVARGVRTAAQIVQLSAACPASWPYSWTTPRLKTASSARTPRAATQRRSTSCRPRMD